MSEKAGHEMMKRKQQKGHCRLGQAQTIVYTFWAGLTTRYARPGLISIDFAVHNIFHPLIFLVVLSFPGPHSYLEGLKGVCNQIYKVKVPSP
jgi:hypothetical protein